MTRAQFDEMREAVIGSGTMDDGEQFCFYVKGESVMVQREPAHSDWFIIQEYQLVNDIPTLVSEGVSK